MKYFLRNRVKSLLSFPKQNGAVLLSVVVAMISVLAIIATGNGLADGIANQLKPASTKKISFLYSNKTGDSGNLTTDDVASLRSMKEVKSIKIVSDTNSADQKVMFNNAYQQATVANKNHFDNLKMVGKHRQLSNNDAADVWLNQGAAWIRPSQYKKLLGQKILIGDQEFNVTGVYQTSLLDGGDLPDVIVPSATFQQLGLKVPHDELDIHFQLNQGEKLPALEDKILHRLTNFSAAGSAGDFLVLDDTMLSGSMHKLVKHISTFIVFISSMSLIVSGLSILNNSYANIAMRSPEIALRRVLGASQKKIRNQFIAESILLLLTGVIIGGVGAKLVVTVLAMFKVKVSLGLFQICMVGLVPLCIGFIASVGPANIAGKKNITTLLRTEYS